jgi:hypothetical protein
MNNKHDASELKHTLAQTIEFLEILPREINHLLRLSHSDETNEISHEKLLAIALDGLRIRLIEADAYLAKSNPYGGDDTPF